MEFNLTTLGILVAVWVVGYLLGLLEAFIKNSKKEAKEDKIAPAESQADGEMSHALEVLEPEVLAIFERMSGALKLRLDGEIVEYTSDLSTEQRERLLNLVISLRPWLDTQKIEKPLAPLPADGKISTMSISTTPAADAKIDLDARAEEIIHSKLSMVEQIDRILQKKLDGSPMEQRGIRLRSAISGGLLIQIGLEEYDAIEKIPEQAIQDIIREASAEWEKNAV